MYADMIVLCDAVIVPQTGKELRGGAAVANGQIMHLGTRDELAGYLGIDTQVVEYHNSTLFTFDPVEKKKPQEANIVVVAGNRRQEWGPLKKEVGLRFLMYQGEVVYQKEL